MTLPRRTLFLLGGWLLACLLLASGPLQAQQGPEGQQAANATLASLLENPETRQQLIDQLRAEAQIPTDAATEAAQEVASEPSLPRQLADATSHVVDELGGQLGTVFDTLTGLFGGGLVDDGGFDMSAFTSAALNLGLVILATFVLFVAIRRLVRPFFTRLSQYSLNGQGLQPLLRLVVCVAVAALIDALVVSLAYVGGNLVATFAVGASGELSTRASLFLNAFLVIELLKAAVRMLFASHYEGLRLLPIGADSARYWNRWIARLIGLAGYGLMVVVPLVNAYLSPALGSAVGTLIMLGAYVYAVAVVMRNRQNLRQALNHKAGQTTMTASRVSLQLFARTWHLFALAYFTVVLVLTLTRPETALPFVLLATLKTLVIVLAGMLISSFLTQTIGRRIRLNDELRRKLPLLESRLNSYVPTALRVARALILIVVVMLVLNAWGAFDLAAWYASETGRGLVGKLVSVILILIVAAAAWLGLASLIEHKLNPETGGVPSARTQTLLALFRNALAIALVTLTAMIVLSEIGINIGPLIAGAGVLGLAIGFGAQKLVQDIITGVFIQIENAMNTGDVITVGGITGVAEKLSIRSVGIRDLSGTYHVVPFSSVDTVSNYMRDFAYHVGEYGIAYRENIDEAIQALRDAFDDLSNDEDVKPCLLEPLEVAGVIALADSSVNIRVRLMTTPGDQWAVGRAYNRLVKLHFDAAGIEIPFPHTTLYFGENKDGSAPPANLRILDKQVAKPEERQHDAHFGPADTGASQEVHNQDDAE
ncbi:mechanosensitive channel protein [Halomonas salina]|uniref:Mechanosensitive ion channel protein MscS n=1 Tax=Halomonas salina TaxID=42565 RepID=A0ABR4WPU4_9GAMM|nr:mechanosensitive channel protein [Halomonas salina]KGE76746.1 mechanosensitive ion channel protein MscS [Halomonas salina]